MLKGQHKDIPGWINETKTAVHDVTHMDVPCVGMRITT